MDKVQKIIDESGFEFQYKVGDLLKVLGWEIQNTPYYTDPITKKSREIDIIARKDFNVRGDLLDRNQYDKIRARLFIECKYIKNSTMLWLAEKNLDKAKNYAKSNSILRGEDDHYLNKSHYIKPNKVIKSAKSEGQKDSVFDAWDQCLNALIFFRKKSYDEGSFVVDFPIVAVDSYSNLYKKDGVNSNYSPVSDPDELQLEIDYSYCGESNNQNTEYFLIDLTSYSRMPILIENLEKNDIANMQDILHWNKIHERNQHNQSDDDGGWTM